MYVEPGGGVLGEQGSTDSGRPGCGWGRSFRGKGALSVLPAEWGGERWLRHNGTSKRALAVEQGV